MRTVRRYPPECCKCYRAARTSFGTAMFVFVSADLIALWFLLDFLTPVLPGNASRWVVFLAAQVAMMVAPITWLMWREYKETKRRAEALCCMPATPDCTNCTFNHSKK